MTYDFPMTAGQFLSALGGGFRRTALDDLLFFLILAAIIVLVAAYFVTQRLSARREMERRSRAVREHLAGGVTLAGEEAALLGRLTMYLRADQPVDAILKDHRVFNACARAMARAERISGSLLDALRVKIGFLSAQPAEMPASTAEIPDGSTIILVTANGKRARGRLRAKGQGSLMIQLARPSTTLRPNVRGTAWFHNSGGLYSFPTRVSTVLPDGVRIEQSGHVVRHQRRRYHREKVSLPVFVRPAADSGVLMKAVIEDLSGGGARIRCPRPLMGPGDQVEVSFAPSGDTLAAGARVVRVTPPGNVVHVEFLSLGESERTRIMGFLFAHSSRRKTPA